MIQERPGKAGLVLLQSPPDQQADNGLLSHEDATANPRIPNKPRRRLERDSGRATSAGCLRLTASCRMLTAV